MLSLALALLLSFGVGVVGAQTSTSSTKMQRQYQSALRAGPPHAAVANGLRQVYRVFVQTETKTKSATAFLISGSRVVATNHHVVEGGRAFLVGYMEDNGRLRRVPLRLLAILPQKDLALLEAVSDLPGDAMKVAMEDPEPASDLYAIGFPAGADLTTTIPLTDEDDPDFFRPSVVRGAVSRIITGGREQTRLQHQTPISVGYSGGPLLNSEGVVVGISTSISKLASGISYGALGADLVQLLDACGLGRGKSQIANTAAGQKSASLSLPSPAMIDMSSTQPEHEALRKRGYRLLGDGNVAGARAIFNLLATRYQLAEGYIGLAATYDPNFLRAINVVGLSGDFAKAAEFYEKARNVSVAKLSVTVAASVEPRQCDRSLCILTSGPAHRLTCEPASEK